MIQLAWLWLKHQPRSSLTQWFHQRVQLNGGRVRKVLIVALARKLLISFWVALHRRENRWGCRAGSAAPTIQQRSQHCHARVLDGRSSENETGRAPCVS